MPMLGAYRNGNTLGLFSRAHRRRYRKVIKVMTKYGLDEFGIGQQIRKVPVVKEKVDPQYLDLPREVRLRMALEELGGAFVKLGQILSNRPDILPEEYLIELEKLQTDSPPFPTEKAIETIETDLEASLGDLFLMFDDEPMASGSIAQVHRAVLYDFTPVVVKVVRPNIHEEFKVDMDIVAYLTDQLKRVPQVKHQFEHQNPIRELRHELEKELDLNNEASNIKRFAKNFADDKRVKVPDVYSPYCSKTYSPWSS